MQFWLKKRFLCNSAPYEKACQKHLLTVFSHESATHNVVVVFFWSFFLPFMLTKHEAISAGSKHEISLKMFIIPNIRSGIQAYSCALGK